MSGRFSPSRLALGYIALSVLALAMFATPLWYAWHSTVGSFRTFVSAEMQALPDRFGREGPAAFAATVRARWSSMSDGEVVVFAGPGKEVLAGTLRNWPAEVPDAQGTYALFIDVGGVSPMRIIASHVNLPGDYHLLMGRESLRFPLLMQRFWYGTAAALAIVLALGAALAWLRHRQTAQLRESEERYERVVLSANAGIWDWDVVKDHYYVSPRLLEMTGFPPGTMFSGREQFMRSAGFHAQDLENWQQAVRQLFAGSDSRVAMHVRMTVRGEARWCDLNGICFRNSTGSVVRFTGSVTDITDRKRAEAALRHSEERYTRVVAAAEAGFWDWDVVQDKYYVSPRLLEMAGLPPGTAISGRADFQARVPLHPEDLAQWQQAIRELFASGGSRLSTELRVIVAGLTRWYRLDGMCFRDAEGRVVRWTGSAIDVTPRRLAEEALRESEQRYERALLASNAGLWEWDVRADKYYISPRHLELLGFAPGTAFSGREDFLRRVPFHPEDKERWRQAQEELFASGGSHLVMDLRVIGGAAMRWVRVNALCFRDAAGTVLRWTGSVTDITEEKGAAEALRLSEERYARAMDGSDAGHWDWNMVDNEVFLSDRARELLALPPDLPATGRADILQQIPMHPDDRDPTGEALKAGIESGVYDRELRVIPRPGELRWLRSRAKVYKDASGVAVRLTGSMVDITARKLAELNLSASEGRYALAMEAAGDGHTDWNLVTGEHYISPRLLEICGYAPGTTFRDRAEWVRRFPFHPEDRPTWERAVAEHFAGRESHFKMELRIVVRGEVRWTAFHFLSTRDAAGAPIRWTGSIGDITEQKRTEEALRLSESRYAVALEAAEEGHFDVQYDTDEHFYSDRLYEIVGIAPGTRFATRAEALKQMRFYGGDAEIYLAGIRAVEARNGPDRYEFEFRIVRPAGEMRWLRTRGKVSRDAEGNIRRRTGVATDITEAKLAEQALRESQERFALAVAGSDDGIWDVDFVARRVFLSARARELTGLPPGPEMVPFEEFQVMLPLHPDDVPRRLAALQAHLTGKAPAYEGEFRLRQLDGVYRWRRIHGICVRDADGRPQRMAGSFSDVDARRRAEDALRASEERYSLAMEASEEGYVDVDIDTDEFVTSDRLNEIFGIARGTRFADREDFLSRFRFHGNDAEIYQAAMRSVAARDGPDHYEFEFRIVRASGEVRWLWTRGQVTRDAEGRARRRIGVVADITARKLAEEARRLSEERYALAMEASEEGHFDWDVRSDELFASAQLKNMLGLHADVAYLTRSEMVAGVPFYPGERERVGQEAREVLAGRALQHEFEYRLLRGRELRWIRARWKIFRGGDGAAQRVIGVVSDITERKLAGEALWLSEERYALAMEVAEEGHLDWNVQSDEFFASAQAKRVLNVPLNAEFRSREDVMGRIPYHPDDLPRVTAEWRASLAGRATEHEFQYRILRGEELRWIRARWKIFRDAQGKARRVIGVVSDVTERRQAVDTLRLSESRFRALTELSSDAYWSQDENLRFLPTGTKYDLAGYRSETDVGLTRWELSDATPLSSTWAEHEAVLQAGKPFRDFEYRRSAPDGSVRYLSISGAPVFDDQGRFRGYQGVGRDISARKRAEEEIRESEARFRGLVELSSDWYWKQDENLRFVGYVPPEVGSRSGVAAASSLGKTRWEFDNVTPLSGTWEDHKAVLAARQPFRDFEYVRVDENGVPHYTVISGTPLFDAEGRFAGYHGVGRNISERRRMEENVRESEARFRRMTELSADTYWETDENFRYTRTGSGHDIAGYHPDVNQGKTRWEMTGDPTPLSTSWQEHQATLAAHQPFRDFEYRRRRPDGTMGYYSASGAPMFDPEGRFKGYQGVARDITEFRRVEEDLRQSEGRFRVLTDLSADWYWQQDEQLRFTYLSRQGATGLPTEAALGKARWEFDSVRPLSGAWAEHQALLAAREPFRDLELSAVAPDGSVSYVSISGAPIFDAHGNFKGYQGTGRNITERKRMEEELRSRQEMLELAQKSAGAVAFEWRIGADGLYRNRSSPELAAMYGVPREAFDGSFDRWKKLVHPQDWPAVKHAIKHALRTGDVATEYRVVHPDGSVHWLHAKGRMFFGADGKPVRMVGFMQDVTERKRIEEELRQSEERYSLAVAGSNEGIFDWDLVSDRVYVSHRAQELFGLPSGELWRPRRDWRHILAFHPDDAPRLHDSIKAHIEGRSPTYDVEFRILLAGGEVRWFRQRGIAMRDAAGKAYRVVGSIGDVTEKHKAEEELRSLERQLRQAQRLEAMGTLAGGIAHDFNNILGAILGYGEMALRDAARGSRLRRDLDSIVVAGERGRALVDRVLAFSRSGVGERVPVHVEKVVREALDLVSARLPPNVTLHGKLHARGAAMLGDATQVHQVVMNLATNAVQAMPAGGTLRVHLDAQRIDTPRVAAIGMLTAAEYLVLKVADTGTGIAPQIMERIFDPFFTTKEVGTGTGLGLSLVHGIVTELGGAIDVASSVGGGSTFTVYLPRSGDAVDTSEDEETELPRGDGQRVLVVDDEEPLVRLATRTLEDLGYTPTGFTSSSAALAAFRADPQRFDALITDERMPGMSGSALIREVRGIRSHMPIVLMSGYVGAAVARQALEAGAEEVLKKPLSARDLAASLARVLHS